MSKEFLRCIRLVQQRVGGIETYPEFGRLSEKDKQFILSLSGDQPKESPETSEEEKDLWSHVRSK
jgi:hypothetical protein